MEKILLNNKKSKKSGLVNNTINVSFKNNKMLLPSTSIDGIVNAYEEYEQERENCTNIRLVCTINPLCTNVLFNNKTEIVYREGSDDPIPIYHYPKGVAFDYKYNAVNTLGNIYTGQDDLLSVYDLIEDTQYSRFDKITYHCGLDMFNNHLIRTNTFKTVMLPQSEEDLPKVNNLSVFNTIQDWVRNYRGKRTLGYDDVLRTADNLQESLEKNVALHLYTYDEIDSFKNAVSNKLTEKNGWIGFINTASVATYDANDKIVHINKPINSRNACEFIDMYPNRELFYFSPIYNEYRHRTEKNWNYCLTYPSSETTDVSFIDQYSKGLKIGVYDDTVLNSNSIESILIYSTCKHGLAKNDTINIYKTYRDDDGTMVSEIILQDSFVNEIVDDYAFYVTRQGASLSDCWITVDELEEKKQDENYAKYYAQYVQVTKYVYSGKSNGEDIYYPIVNNKVNLSDSNQQFSFRKVEGGEECEYYVRIFSRIPNWKFADTKPTEYELSKADSKLVEKYKQLNYEFENHTGRIAFANNIYNDEVSEIVFTDDINIANLKDNKKRPLTSIYLTILKNNRGYKDWYGTPQNASTKKLDLEDDKYSTLDASDVLKNNDTLEYSHCFGKLSCGFKLSYRSLINKELSNVMRINHLEDTTKPCSKGLNCYAINSANRNSNYTEDDEIIYRYFDSYKTSGNLSGDTEFYGDLVCFSPHNYNEQVLQIADFRFNTAQRDGYATNLIDNQLHSIDNDQIQYNEITSDDFDYKKISDINDNSFFTIEETKINDAVARKEGYYYQGHYEIPINTFASTISSQSPKLYNTKYILHNGEADGRYIIKTLEKTYIENYDNIVLYDKTSSGTDETAKYYNFMVEKVSDRRLIFVSGDTLDDDIITHSFKIIRPDETIPEYAVLLKDLSFKYVWREILHNGDDDDSDVETYPFTNGALYAHKFINFYLKRQDPNNYIKDYAWDGNMVVNNYPTDITANLLDDSDKNNYTEEEDIVC